MQSIWKGAISFGLVSIPVRLYSATEEKDISFRQVHREDGGRIRYKRVCSVDGEEVPYADIAKGYELPDGEMVVLEDEDFANLPISTSRAVEVLEFVPAEQVDPVMIGKPYYCDPTGADAKPYLLLRNSLEKADRVAIVKVALRQRERLAMLRPRDGVLVLQTLLWPDEVREARFSFLDEDVSVRPQELAMAESYISALSADFDPGEFTDEYRQALEEVIQAKVAGREVKQPQEAPQESGQVVDLMEALRRSVAEAKSRRGESASSAGDEAASASDATGKTAQKTARKSAQKTAQTSPGARKSAKKAPAKPQPKAGGKKAAAKKATGNSKSTAAKKSAAKRTDARKTA
ncbi:MAG: end-binding protein Ku [Actinomycetota bacterium]|jgi:DNA end-binding protein Ku|nr:end-binding protein Ku [Actinomycetota bacterium]